ncbi:type II secretion system protein N [Legionella septentrionalis]|uniref:General secretion pathway protein GspC n=1 Tax=Legionella septentrionalis TaxID=2498109 RepID=A0A3S0X2Z5_9GAMM|nr:type II secretion system protein N [Legionella septentrionalis]RUQ81001.1 general secretion pathway protein GspC [Legionella septentrionalis]
MVFADIKSWLARPAFPIILCAILGMLIVWQIIAGVRTFSAIYKPVPVVQVASMRNNAITEASAQDVRASLFGEYVPENLDDAHIKQSMLNLTIVGIIFAEDERHSQVIIRTASGQEQVYGIGDAIPGGVIIKRITSEGVVVRRDGTLESLSLPKNELIFEPPSEPLIKE